VAQQGPVGQPTQFEVRVPPEMEGGVYANFLGVWHTNHEFTLDFSATLPPEPIETPDGPGFKVPCRVTARVKVPPTLVFEIIRALNDNMTVYEGQFGSIPQPGNDDPLFPPDGDVDLG
jgi:hypothetical protein